MEKNLQAWRRMLLLGAVFALLTVLGGEIPLGWTVYPEVENELMGMLAAPLSMVQLASGVLFGCVFIPLQCVGFLAVGRIVEAGGNRRSGRIIRIGAVVTAMTGGTVHGLCAAMMYLPQRGLGLEAALEFILWLVLPITAVMMAFYLPMCLAMLLAIARRRTMLPRWAALLNPLTGKLLLNLLAELGLNTPLMNGLRMANMGLGSLITFGGLWWLLGRQRTRE